MALLSYFSIPTPALTEMDEMGSVDPSGEVIMTGQTETILDQSDASNSGEITSGQIISLENNVLPPPVIEFIPQPKLVLSEVFFDGSDEWFEITNIGSGSFSGILSVRGAKSSELSLGWISVTPGTSLVRGDTMTQITNKSVILGTALGLSISDSSQLSVSLLQSGLLLDDFIVDALSVGSLPNNYGFEKIRSGGSLLIASTSTGRIVNISGSRIANPGTIFTRTPPSVTPTTGNQVAIPDLEIPPLTTGFVPSITSNIITISEIHPTNDMLPEYLELHFHRSFSGSLIVQGLGTSTTSKTLTLYALTGQYVVIAETASGFVDAGPLVMIDHISLTDGGESLALADLSGNIYDKVLYTGSVNFRSRYPDPIGLTHISTYPTPGFSEKSLVYIPTSLPSAVQQDSAKDSYYQALYKKRKERYYDLKTQLSIFGLGIDRAGRAFRKEGITVAELADGTEEFTDAPKQDQIYQLRIVAVLPDAEGKDDGKESVTLELLSGSLVDLNDMIIRANSKKTPLQGVLGMPGDTLTFHGNFGFPNKPSCLTLEQRDTTYDTFCYGQPYAGVRIGLTGNISADTSLSGVNDFTWMKQLSLSLMTGEACALFGNTPFSCITIKPILDQKTKDKMDKKMASLQSKFAKKQRQYTGLQERYKEMKSTLDSKWRKYYQQVKTVRTSYKQKLADSTLELKIRKNYGKLIQSHLKDNWQNILEHSDIATINAILQDNIDAYKGQKTGSGTKIILYGREFAIGDIKKQYLLSSDPAVVLDMLVGKLLTILSLKEADIRENWLEKWYADKD